MSTDETVHACPSGDSGLMPCCGRTPFEVSWTARLTTDADAVTCAGQVDATRLALEAIQALHVGVPRPSMRGRGTEMRCKACTSQLAPCPTWLAADRGLHPGPVAGG